MPTYEFKCKKCDKRFSQVLTITEYSQKKSFSCPYCKSKSTMRIFSNFTAVTSKKS